MAVARDPTTAEIARYLATRSGSQMVQLMRTLREPAAQVAFTTQLMLVPPPVKEPTKATEKQKKALNAFVG